MLDWFANRWNNLVDVFYSIILSIYDMLKDVLCFAFEAFLSVIYYAINGIGYLFSSLNIVQYLTMLPPDVQSTMALVGVNDASAIIVSAIFIRLALQLVPFTRLGS